MGESCVNSQTPTVLFVMCNGVAQAVVKQRGSAAQKAVREECHYMLAEMLGAHSVAAPCIAIELDLVAKATCSDSPQKAGKYASSVCALVAETFAQAWTDLEGACPSTSWFTVEKCIQISPPSSCTGLSLRLANPLGCIDLMQAYLATPDGQASFGSGLLRGIVNHGVTDADFAEVLSGLCVASVHRLCLLALIALQRDGSPSNLVLQELPRANKSKLGDRKQYALITIDATKILGSCPCDLLRLIEESDSNAYLGYWYPLCVALPQAAQPFHEEVAKEILLVDASEVQSSLSASLAAAPGASCSQCDADAEAAAGRLHQLQSMLQEDMTRSVRECCFDIVTSWRTDLKRATEIGELGRLPELEVHLINGGDGIGWGRWCMLQRLRNRSALAFAAGFVGFSIAAAIRIGRRRWA